MQTATVQAAFALRGVVERMQASPDELETMIGEEYV